MCAYQTDGFKKKLPNAANGPLGPVDNKTPAPVIDVARDHTWGRGGYGSNGASDPSSIAPGTKVTSVMADNLKASGDKGGLDVIASKGMGLRDQTLNTFQTRTVSDMPFPPAFGHRNVNASPPTIPGAVEKNEGAPARQPPPGKGQL